MAGGVRFLGWMVVASVSLSAAQGRDLKAFFQRACAQCHGTDGSARGPGGQRLGGRVLNSASWQARMPSERLAKSIRTGKNTMPSFEAQLTEAEALRLVEEVIRPLAVARK